jgi:N-acetylglucosaminyldiphosphoundecaprenol N-acetyl-beta-D-mannosaminyltransferase
MRYIYYRKLKTKKINILGINVDNFSYDNLLNLFSESIENKINITVSYANAHTLTEISSNIELRKLIEKFGAIHADGIGVYLASKFLYGKSGLNRKFVGSDFYNLLIKKGVEKNWKFYFFGHDFDTLKGIRSNCPDLNIAGIQEGYSFQTDKVIERINDSKPDILIVGLGFPLQEQWISENCSKINTKVILSVGGGIKIFSGTKVRGPVIVQRLGLEWLIRLLNEPGRLWKRYLIGIPIFIFNVIKFKLKLMSEY